MNEHTYLRTHKISGELLRFRLDAGERRLREQAAGSKAGRAAQTLVKEGPLRITQVALRKGTPLQSHQVAGAVSLQVRRGRLRLTLADDAVDLGPGELVALGAGVAHGALALSECALLITTAMP
jgi:quercetin dioxygenase-like cupin family protein